jgi:hypothetical protein
VSKSAREISAVLRAAGVAEEARVLLADYPGYERQTEMLKRIADDLAATAVAERVRIANDPVQNYGRD